MIIHAVLDKLQDKGKTIDLGFKNGAVQSQMLGYAEPWSEGRCFSLIP